MDKTYYMGHSIVYYSITFELVYLPIMGISSERGTLCKGRPRLTQGRAPGGPRLPKGEITPLVGYLPILRGAEKKKNGEMGKSKGTTHARAQFAPSCIPGFR